MEQSELQCVQEAAQGATSYDFKGKRGSRMVTISIRFRHGAPTCATRRAIKAALKREQIKAPHQARKRMLRNFENCALMYTEAHLAVWHPRVKRALK